MTLALPLAAINGALTWHAMVSTLDVARREEYAVPVPALLQEFLGAAALLAHVMPA